MGYGYFDIGFGNYLPDEYEHKSVAECGYCGQDLYVGDTVLYYDGYNYCCERCLFDDLHIETIELED